MVHRTLALIEDLFHGNQQTTEFIEQLKTFLFSEQAGWMISLKWLIIKVGCLNRYIVFLTHRSNRDHIQLPSIAAIGRYNVVNHKA